MHCGYHRRFIALTKPALSQCITLGIKSHVSRLIPHELLLLDASVLVGTCNASLCRCCHTSNFCSARSVFGRSTSGGDRGGEGRGFSSTWISSRYRGIRVVSMVGLLGRLLAKSISGTMSAAAEYHVRCLRWLSLFVWRTPWAGAGRGLAVGTTAVLSLLLRLQRHPLAVLSFGHLNSSTAVASLLGSDMIPFSGSDDEPPLLLNEEKREEFVIVRSARAR